MHTKRAILYARVSTPRQAELYSLDFQLEQERVYAADMGFRIVAELKDDQSGRKLERDYFTEARNMLARDEADVLVTWKLDRLHRSYINTVILRDEIQKMGKELHYAQLRMKSGATAKQRLPEDVMALMAEIEADEIAERTQMGKREKAKAQKWVGLFKAPYGFRQVGTRKDTALIIDEEQAEVVRNIFKWYMVGEGSEGPIGPQHIAEKLTALGLPTPQDLVPSHVHTKQRGYAQWDRQSIYKILKRTAYMGVYYNFRYKVVNGKRVNNTNKDEWIPVPVPQIVDPALFEAAQKKLVDGRILSSRGTKVEYLLGRRVWCECGYKMVSLSSNKERTMIDGTVKGYIYRHYKCQGRTKLVRSCDMPSQNVAWVDDRVWEWVKEEIANPLILERKLREIQDEQRQNTGSQADTLRKLLTYKSTLEQEMKRLVTLYARQEIPAHLLDDLITEQNTKLRLTEAEIVKTERDLETPLTDEAIASLVSFAEDFRGRLEIVEQSFEAKRTVIDGLDVKVVVTRQDNEVVLKVSCILSPDSDFLALSSPS